MFNRGGSYCFFGTLDDIVAVDMGYVLDHFNGSLVLLWFIGWIDKLGVDSMD